MDKNKITIVSGEPRSGTSLMMQTLKALGMPLTGSATPQEDRMKHFLDDKGEWLPEYIDRKEDIERRMKHSEMMNPIGFYETEFVSSGVRGVDAERFKGKVMKIITSGIPVHHGPRGMHGTDKKLIDKIILCVRNPKNIAVSQKNLVDETVLVAGKNEDEGWVYNNDSPPSPLAFLQRTGPFLIWLDDNADIIKDILVVEYEDMQSDPKTQIQRVIDFLNIDHTEQMFEAAVKNVKPALARSKSFKEWPEKFKDDGELAMGMYDALSSMDLEKITLISAELKERTLKNRLERSEWIDDDEHGEGTWIRVNPDLIRSIIENRNYLRTNLLSKVGWTNKSSNCSHNKSSEKEYTIERPDDLGDLKRKMVFCKRDQDHKTIEQCNMCWSFGYRRNGRHFPPESKNEKNLVEA